MTSNQPPPPEKKKKFSITPAAKPPPKASGQATTTTTPPPQPNPTPAAAAVVVPMLPPAADAHLSWLHNVAARVTSEPKLAAQWYSHKQWTTLCTDRTWRHYAQFDVVGHQYLWRFSSRPSTESISIQPGVTIDVIVDLIGEHSGGNKKTDPRVQTSSFCRNLGALIGAAASRGGDKKVLNIISKAAYVCRIDIGGLRDQGVSAVPAASRAISLFETEYVLVPTPGTSHLLMNLGAVVFKNPFLGCITDAGQFQGCVAVPTGVVGQPGQLPVELPATFALAGKEMPAVAVEAVNAADLPAADIAAILRFAAACSPAATTKTGAVQDKEPLELGVTVPVITDYVEEIYKTFQ